MKTDADRLDRFRVNALLCELARLAKREKEIRDELRELIGHDPFILRERSGERPKPTS
jgi:hypothetical protein